MTRNEICELIENKSAELTKTRFALRAKELQDFSKIGKIRREIARLKTKLNSQEEG